MATILTFISKLPKMYDFHWSNAKYTNPPQTTIPLIRPHQCDSEGGRIRGVLLHKLNTYIDIIVKNCWQPCKATDTNRLWCTDMHTIATYQCRTNYFKCSFFSQTIVAWNTLPKSVVTSSTLDAFKAVLPLRRPIPSWRFWTHQPFLFLVLQPF